MSKGNGRSNFYIGPRVGNQGRILTLDFVGELKSQEDLLSGLGCISDVVDVYFPIEKGFSNNDNRGLKGLVANLNRINSFNSNLLYCLKTADKIMGHRGKDFYVVYDGLGIEYRSRVTDALKEHGLDAAIQYASEADISAHYDQLEEAKHLTFKKKEVVKQRVLVTSQFI